MKYLDWGIYNFIVQEIILSKEKRNYSCCHLIFTKVSRIKVFLDVVFEATFFLHGSANICLSEIDFHKERVI